MHKPTLAAPCTFVLPCTTAWTGAGAPAKVVVGAGAPVQAGVQGRTSSIQVRGAASVGLCMAQDGVGRYRPRKERRTGVQVKEEDLEVQMREKIDVIKIKKQD